MATMSWLSRLVLGQEVAARTMAAQERYTKTLNGCKFDADKTRAELKRILNDVEQKANSLSTPPPQEQHGRRQNESENRTKKAGTG